MQTPILPLPTFGANAAQAPKVSFNAPGQDGNQFQQALSREMENRQQSTPGSHAPTRAPDKAAAPQPGAKAPAPAAQNQQADASDQPADTAPADAAAQPDAKADAPATAGAASGARKGDDDDSGHSDAKDAADGAVSDMLALVAALNPPPAPAANTAAANAGAAASASDAPTAAVPTPTDAASGLALDPAALNAAAASTTADGDATVIDFKEVLTKVAHARAAPDPASAAAATEAASGGKDAAKPVLDASIKDLLKPDSSGKTAPAADAARLSVDASGDPKQAGSGADLLGKLNTKPAAGDGSAVQTSGERQQQGDAGQIPVLRASAEQSPAAASTKQQAAAPAPAITIAPAAQAALDGAKAAAAAPPADKLGARVGSQAWDQQLGQKIVFMAAGGEQSATMELNPPDLGPLQVVLSVNKDQASAAFSAAQPEVRQALEAALPKLREMMSDAGIQLGSATVSAGMTNQQHNFNQQAAQAQLANSGSGSGGGGGSRYGRDDSALDSIGRAAAPPRRLPAGAVDTFA